MKYMIGQRVIYQNVICTICMPDREDQFSQGETWINNPEKGYKHWVSEDNIRPLPNGQL